MRRIQTLVVDDEALVRDLIALTLTELCDVSVAIDAPSALLLAGEQNFELFLIDLHLEAGPTGIELVRALRQRPQYADVPMIAISGHLDLAGTLHLDRAGFTGTLPKPFTPEQLREVVRRQKPVSGRV